MVAWVRLGLEGYVGGGGLLDFDGYFHHGRYMSRLGKPESRSKPKPKPNLDGPFLVIANEVTNYSVINGESSVIHKLLRISSRHCART